MILSGVLSRAGNKNMTFYTTYSHQNAYTGTTLVEPLEDYLARFVGKSINMSYWLTYNPRLVMTGSDTYEVLVDISGRNYTGYVMARGRIL